jgi:hypothetical protein
MEVDDDLKGQILGAVAPIVGGSLAAGLAALAASELLALVTTNHEMDTPAGKVELHPTNAKTAMSSTEVEGSKTSGSLAKDDVGAVKGEVAASETEAAAAVQEATAADVGATASRTKAGASDIETKALKMT